MGDRTIRPVSPGRGMIATMAVWIAVAAGHFGRRPRPDRPAPVAAPTRARGRARTAAARTGRSSQDRSISTTSWPACSTRRSRSRASMPPSSRSRATRRAASSSRRECRSRRPSSTPRAARSSRCRSQGSSARSARSRSSREPALDARSSTRRRDVDEIVRRGVPALDNAFRYREARRLADTDALTGLRNRRFFHETLQRECTRAHRYGRSLALLVLDVDDFKAINERVGHLAGRRRARRDGDATARGSARVRRRVPRRRRRVRDRPPGGGSASGRAALRADRGGRLGDADRDDRSG